MPLTSLFQFSVSPGTCQPVLPFSPTRFGAAGAPLLSHCGGMIGSHWRQFRGCCFIIGQSLIGILAVGEYGRY